MTSRQMTFPFAHQPHKAVQLVIPVVLGLLALLAAVLLWRRVAGALSEPLPPAASLTAGIALAAIAATFRLAHRAAGQFADVHRLYPPARCLWAEGSLSVLLVVVAATISLPGSTPLGLTLLWGPLLVGECAWWSLTIIGNPTRRDGRCKPAGHVHKGIADCFGKAARAESTATTSEQTASEQSEQVVQQFVRTRCADGKEKITGWLRIDFAPGQRTAVAHVTFCPPLGGAPTLTVRQQSGPECRIKTAQVLPYGARVELRLVHAADHPQQVLVEFEAHD